MRKSICREELVEYYKTHTTTATAKFFGVSFQTLKNKLREYDIPIHTQSESNKLGYEENDFHSRNAKKAFEEILSRIAKDSIEEFYKNHTIEETVQYFDITKSRVNQILDYYKIKHHTTPEAKRIRYINQYGSYEAGIKVENDKRAKSFNKEAANKKRVDTNIQKYEGLSPFSSDIVKAKAKQSFLKKYGVDNPFKIKGLVKNKIIEKYGVNSTSQIPEIRAKQVKNSKNCLAIDGRRFDSSWEVKVYEYCLENNIQIETSIPIKYLYEGEQHITFIDFQIRGKLYEVKGDHLLEGVFDKSQKVPIEAKLKIYREHDITVITDTKLIKDMGKYEGINFLDINSIKF